ncbi:hypothetical protein AB5N19_05149 [Seiridium cardinale]
MAMLSRRVNVLATSTAFSEAASATFLVSTSANWALSSLKLTMCKREHKALCDVKLESRDSAALNGFGRSLHPDFNRNEDPEVDAGDPSDHAATDDGLLLRGHNDALDVPVTPFAELKKARLGALYERVLKSCTHDVLLFCGLSVLP